MVVALARELGRPVRYVETRSETMIEMQHGRAQVQDVEIGGTRDGKVTGLKVRVIADCGAYPADAALMPMLTGLMASGVYEIPKVDFHFDCVVTNTTPIGAYRGAGRPEATALVERAIDLFAAELEMDPAEVRRRNFIPDFPHQTVTGANYDSGEYRAALDKCLANAGYDALRAEQARAARARRRQAARARPVLLRRVDRVRLRARHLHGRRGRHGHRHRRHLLARPGPRDHVRAARRRDARRPDGRRQGHPVRHQARQARHGHDGLALAAGRRHALSRTPPTRCSTRPSGSPRTCWRRTRATSRSSPARAWRGGLAASAIPWARAGQRGRRPGAPPEGFEAGLASENDFETPDATYPFGTHLAVVEVDTETGLADLIRHITVDDSGRIANPMLVEGQIHGGIAQGVAQALFEEIAFDEDGNNVTGSLAQLRDADRGRPADVRDRAHADADAAQPAGRQGHRRVGRDRRDARRSGTPSIDALAHLGVRNIDMPATPQRVWQAISEASGLIGSFPAQDGQRGEQRVHVLSRRPDPEAGPDRSGQLGVAAGLQLGVQPARLGVRHAQQVRDERVRAEAAVAHADREAVAEGLRQRVVVVAREVERGDADPVVMGGPEPVAGEAVDRLQPGVQPRGERPLARLGLLHVQRVAGRGERDGADHVR